MSKRLWLSTPIVVAATAILGWSLLVYPLEPVDVASVGAFVFGIALLVRLRLHLPHGEAMTTSSALASASLLVFPVPISLLVIFAGTLLGSVNRHTRLTLPQAAVVAGRGVLAAAAALLVYRVLGGTYPGGEAIAVTWATQWVPILGLLAAYHMSDFVMEEFGLNVYTRDARVSLRQLVELVRVLGPTHVALSSLGILTALLYGHLGTWVLILVVSMLLLFRHALKLYLEVADAHEGTIMALAKAIDFHGDIAGPKSEQVERISRELGREMGLTIMQLDTLSRAAWLMNLGLIGAEGNETAGHARRAQEMLERVDGLRYVSAIVGHQDAPEEANHLPETQRVMAQCLFVAKTWSAMTRAGLSSEDAFAIVLRDSSSKLHLKVNQAIRQIVDSGHFGVCFDLESSPAPSSAESRKIVNIGATDPL